MTQFDPLNQPSSSKLPANMVLNPSSPSDTDAFPSLALPPAIVDQFALIQKHLTGLRSATDRLESICPLIRKTQKLRELGQSIESCQVELSNQLTALHKNLQVPFTIKENATDTDADGQDQATLIVRDRLSDFITVKGVVPQCAEETPPLPMDPFSAYQVSVTRNEDSDFSQWHLPYRVVFTPDPNWGDMNTGEALPSLSINVDEIGRVTCSHGQPRDDDDEDDQKSVSIPYSADAASVNVLLAAPSFEPVELPSPRKNRFQRFPRKRRGKAREELDIACPCPVDNSCGTSDPVPSASIPSTVSTIPFPVVSPIKLPPVTPMKRKDNAQSDQSDVFSITNKAVKELPTVLNTPATPKDPRTLRRSTRTTAQKQKRKREDEEINERIISTTSKAKRRKL
ncbi:hypothetical protein BJ138DRAFT_269495 [Hygrophoropsis aurantiaca]|uniref:Uncharacterized protein n=1 Tax=Hygrophoropsis aurantiaca TaxID=72124 RepID=A0ACB8API6_9AGAM|nr:hypothetical protein BJ138DRAFT_269495 [Hygrophoropsis aurantiaca]